MARLRPEQWADIHAEWIGTDKPLREMAKAYGVDEKSIRLHAESGAWGPRNASGRKREIVAYRLAGGAETPHQTPHRGGGEDAAELTPQQVETNIDVNRMRDWVEFYGETLDRCRVLIKAGLDPRDVNQTVDAARKAMDGYRRIRGLDEPAKPAQVIPVAYQALSDDELAKAVRDAGGI